MALSRKKSILQMKKISDIIKKEGGDIGEKTKKAYQGKPNMVYSENPFTHPEKIHTIEDHMTLEVEKIIPFSEFKKVNEKHSDESMEETIDYINTVIETSPFDEKIMEVISYIDKLIYNLSDDQIEKFELDFNQGLYVILNSKEYGISEIKKIERMIDDYLKESVNFIAENTFYNIVNREIKNLRTWPENIQQKSSNHRERPIITGQQIVVGDISGYVKRVEGSKVYIDANNGKEEIISLKKVIKEYKPKKDKKEIVSDLGVQGPNNTSVSKIPSEVKKSEVSLELDQKSKFVKDNKISQKNTEEKILKLKSFNEK